MQGEIGQEPDWPPAGHAPSRTCVVVAKEVRVESLRARDNLNCNIDLMKVDSRLKLLRIGEVITWCIAKLLLQVRFGSESCNM